MFRLGACSVAIFLIACGPSQTPGGGSSDGESSTGTAGPSPLDTSGSGGGSGGGTSTGHPPTTGVDSTGTSVTATASEGTTLTTTEGGTTDGATTGDPTTDSGPLLDLPGAGGLPDGEACMLDAECSSHNCYQAGLLGGICGECNSDADCVGGGCTVPNPLAGIGSVCNMGELGGGCETDVVCQPGLTCETILSVPGVITANTCSECAVDADCVPGSVCSPTYDVVGLGGVRTCELAGTVAVGEGCDLGEGVSECSTGLCAPASLMGIVSLGVCSECITDLDCPLATTCAAAQIDLALGLIPAQCI